MHWVTLPPMVSPCGARFVVFMSIWLQVTGSGVFGTAFVTEAQAPRADASRHASNADAHRGYGRLAEAEADYRTALSIDPRHLAARRGLGVVLDLIGRHAEAKEEFVTALQAAERDAEAGILLDLAASYAFEGKFGDARRALAQVEHAWRRNHGRGGSVAAMLFQIALAEGNLGDAEQLAHALRESARNALTDAPADEYSALLHRANADLDLAARLAVIAARRGQREAALEQLSRVEGTLMSVLSRVSGGPENAREIPSYAGPAGEVAYLLGDDLGAIEFLSSPRLQPGPQATLTLGQAYERRGDHLSASVQYRKVIANRAHGLELALARPIAQSRLAALGR